jgi:cytochrome d ubiquinol oxidase subunit II
MDLQLTWFVLVAILLAGYAVLDGFDLGIGVLYPFVARNSGQKAMLRSAIGPVWDGNEVWLVTGAGALFAAFPPVYAMVFSGFYLAVMLILFGLIFRAVAIEMRSHDPGWGWFWDASFFGGSVVAAVLFGCALGNVVRGVPLDANGDYAGTFLQLLNPFALLVAVTGLLMIMTQGACWAALKIEGQLRLKAMVARSAIHWIFVAALAGLTLFSVFEIPERMQNVVSRPLGWLALAVLVAAIVTFRIAVARGADLIAFVGSSATIVALMGLAAIGNYPAIVPARGTPPATSLTVENASATDHALTVMLIIACIGLPIVLGYTTYVYRAFRGKVDPSAGGY